MKRFALRVAHLLEHGARACEQLARDAAFVRAVIRPPSDNEHVTHLLQTLVDTRREVTTLRRELADEREEHERAIDRAGVALARATTGETGRLRARGERIAELEQRLDERLRDLVAAQQSVASLKTEIVRLNDVLARAQHERDAAKLAFSELVALHEQRLNDEDELEAPPSTEGP